jgi:hypothetical protein
VALKNLKVDKSAYSDSLLDEMFVDDEAPDCLAPRAETAAINYIEARRKLIHCRQKHFKQLCQRCREWKKDCRVYASYVDAWMKLQESVKEESHGAS